MTMLYKIVMINKVVFLVVILLTIKHLWLIAVCITPNFCMVCIGSNLCISFRALSCPSITIPYAVNVLQLLLHLAHLGH